VTDDGVIAELPKNATEIVRVERTSYRGHDLIDARVWMKGLLPGDEPTRTRKGLCLSPKLWRALLPEIAKALDEPDEPHEAE